MLLPWTSLGKLFQESETKKFLAHERVDVAQLRQVQSNNLDVQNSRRPAVETLEEEKGTCFYEKDGLVWRQ